MSHCGELALEEAIDDDGDDNDDDSSSLIAHLVIRYSTRWMCSDKRLLMSITWSDIAGIETSVLCGVSGTNKQLFCKQQ